MAIQQVVYSVQGAVSERAGVQLLLDGQHTDMVLGEPASEPVTNAPIGDTLSQMSITSPEEGQVVSGKFEASGVNNSFEATVAWQILQGDKVVDAGSGMADACCEPDKLFPWALTVDVSAARPRHLHLRRHERRPHRRGGGPRPRHRHAHDRGAVGPCGSAGYPAYVGRAPGSGG